MPHIRDDVPMHSVVYVIIEDRESHGICFSPAILIDVVELSTGLLDYKVELMNKCGIHQAHQYVTVHDKDIFRTDDECQAVREDRHTRLQDANKISEFFNKQIKNLLNIIQKKEEELQQFDDQIEEINHYIVRRNNENYQKENVFHHSKRMEERNLEHEKNIRQNQENIEKQKDTTAGRNEERTEYDNNLEKTRQQHQFILKTSKLHFFESFQSQNQ